MKRHLFILLLFSLPHVAQAQVDTVRTAVREIEDRTRTGAYGNMFGNNRSCSLACAILWTIESTSHLDSQSGNTYYNADNLSDIDPSSAWVEGERGYGIGTRIVIRFQEADLTGVAFRGMAVHNGYAKDEATWKANGRVQHLRIWQNGKPKLVIELKDTMSPQYVEWEDVSLEVEGGETIELEVTSVYPGKRYADIALTNINLFGAH